MLLQTRRREQVRARVTRGSSRRSQSIVSHRRRTVVGLKGGGVQGRSASWVHIMKPGGSPRTGDGHIAPPARIERAIAAHGAHHLIGLHRRMVMVVVVTSRVHRIEGPAVDVRVGRHSRVHVTTEMVVVMGAGRLVHLTEEARRRRLPSTAPAI